jgi:hypothetical protein
MGAVIAPHDIYGDSNVSHAAGINGLERAKLPRARKLFAFGLHDLAAAIEAVGADVVAQMRFTGGRLNGQRRVGQEIMRAMHTALGRGLLVLLDCHFLLLKIYSHPSDGAFTFCVHHCQRQAQQHFILNQINQVQGLPYQNRISVGQCLQPLQLDLAARQMNRAHDFDPMPHVVQATLTGQLHLAPYLQLQEHSATRADLSNHSTEQRALRKFLCETRERRHFRLGFP